jgi:hypothetical protein
MDTVTESAGGPVGKVLFTIGKDGKTTGKVSLTDKKVYPFTATLTSNGTTAQTSTPINVIKGPFNTSKLYMNLQIAANGTVTGGGISQVEGVGGYLLDGYKIRTFSKTSPCAWDGAYTIAWSDPTPANANNPDGAGYATATVKLGVLALKGKLGDGTAITATASPDTHGTYRIFTTPYTTTGSYFSTVITLTKTGRSDNKYHVNITEDAETYWFKKANSKDKVYKAGFGPLALTQYMEPWTAPAKGATPAGVRVNSSGKLQVTFTGAGLPANASKTTLPTKLTANTTGFLAVGGDVGAPSSFDTASWAKLWTAKLAPATGLLTGSFTILEAGKPKKITFEGILLQHPNGSDEPFFQGFYTYGTKTGKIEFPEAADSAGNVGSAGNYTLTYRFTNPAKVVTSLGGRTFTQTIKNPPSLTKLTVVSSFTNDQNVKVSTYQGTLNFEVADDGSGIRFNGRLLSRLSNSISAAVYSDVKGTDSLTVTLNLNTTTGAIVGVSALYVQASSATALTTATLTQHSIVKN